MSSHMKNVFQRVERHGTILIAGMGTSPAVLTETVWALAHQALPVVPDEIVVITTKSGKDALRTAVMSGEPSVWERLKAALRKEKIAIDGKLVFGETSIRVMPDESGNEIVDLRTGTDNLRAADFMLGELRKYTEDTETTILCSIAGGRKTMSALLFSCMTLLGREQDKVYHVLLPPVFEQGVEPPFFFPEPGMTYTARSTRRTRYRANCSKFRSCVCVVGIRRSSRTFRRPTARSFPKCRPSLRQPSPIQRSRLTHGMVG